MTTFGPFWSSVVKGRVPAFAGSDILAGSLVTVTSADRNVQMVATTNQEPLGVARDDTAASAAVTVFDLENTCRVLAGATVTAGQNVGVIGATQVTHPVTGNLVNQPLVGPVAGASGSVVWRAGVAEENAVSGQVFSCRVNPHQLSGLA